jgi:hypothetical protein
MKRLLLVVLLCAGFGCLAETAKDVFYHPSPDIEVIWKAETNWPRVLRIYKATPGNFLTTTISNALTLASFGKQDLVVSNHSVIRFQDHKGDRWTRSLDILPAHGQILYRSRAGLNGPPEGVPSDEEVAKRAWEFSARLGIERSQLIEKPENCKSETCERSTEICARGISLTRIVDGLEIDETGFGVNFGNHAQLRSFYLIWPSLQNSESSPTATREQISAWIKEGKALPTVEELQDPATIKKLAEAKKLTITKITLRYGQGRYGEMPTGESEQLVSPFGLLEGIAEVGDSNINCKFYCPILSQVRDKP